MMLSRVPPSKVEVFAYFTMVLGIFGDHLSTGIALSKEGFIEANSMALSLMQKGIWVQTDAFLILISISVTFTSLRIVKNPLARLILVFPFLIGLVRLVVTLWNVSLLI
jgi:hypothetical protein